jgi:hypothetical protein
MLSEAYAAPSTSMPRQTNALSQYSQKALEITKIDKHRLTCHARDPQRWSSQSDE